MSASHHEPKSAPEPPAPPRRRSSSNKQLESSTSRAAAARRSSSSKVPAGTTDAPSSSAPSRRSHAHNSSKPQPHRPHLESSSSSLVSSGRTQPRTFDGAASQSSSSSSPHSSGRSQPRTSSSELVNTAVESTAPPSRQARTARSSSSSRAHSHPPPSSSELAASTRKTTTNTKLIEGDNEEDEKLYTVEVEESSSLILDPDDEPLPPDDHNHRCYWRLPPQQSHSDWTLLVVAVPNGSNIPDERHHDDGDNDGKDDHAGAGTDASEAITGVPVKAETTYPIHRGILAASAPRKCRYFTRLFAAEPTDPNDTAQKISRMELPALAARAVPILLDYLYDPSAPLAADTSTACALHYLGNHLECPQLCWDAMQFWKRDIQYFNYHTYYQHAMEFHNDKILQALAKSCGQNILCIQPSSSSFVMDAAPEFWPRILNHVPHTKEASRHASKIVDQVIKAHARDMEASLFEALTDPNRLPFVDVSVASHLLDAYDYFREDEDECEAGAYGRNEQPVSTPLSSIQARCVEAIAQNWLRLANAPNNARFLSRQKPSILTELLDQVLVFADRTVVENQRVIANLKKTRRPRSSHR